MASHLLIALQTSEKSYSPQSVHEVPPDSADVKSTSSDTYSDRVVGAGKPTNLPSNGAASLINRLPSLEPITPYSPISQGSDVSLSMFY